MSTGTQALRRGDGQTEVMETMTSAGQFSRPSWPRVLRLAVCLALSMGLIVGCVSPALPAAARFAAAGRIRYPVARQYWAVMSAARQIRLDDGLRQEGGEGSYAACPGSNGSQDRYKIVGTIAPGRQGGQTALLLAAVAALEHDLAHEGWGQFRWNAADRRYLTASRGSITVSFFDIANAFDSVPPPSTEQFVVSGPCTNLAAVAPYLRNYFDSYGLRPAPLPPLKVP